MIPSRRCARLSPQPILTPSGALPLAAPPRQALVATLGYNNVEARLLAPVGFSFVAAAGDCAATLTPKAGFALAGEVVLEAQFIADGELLRREHRVFLGFSEERTDFFVENVDWVAGLFDGEPFAPLDDADGDGSPNTYDYTPLPGIDLTRLDEPLNSGNNIGIESAPYPIFNIWQLQAIGGTVRGVVKAEDRESVLQAFFGTNPGNLINRYYRLSVDIDASPTRDWNDGKGFDPIRFSSAFGGSLDGGDKVIRNLYINRPEDDDVGLFGGVNGDGDIAGIGLQNAVIVGRNQVGAIAGRIQFGFRIEDSWAQGRVVGGEGVGGIVGQIENTSTVSQSWFAGDVVGDIAGGFGGRYFGKRFGCDCR